MPLTERRRIELERDQTSSKSLQSAPGYSTDYSYLEMTVVMLLSVLWLVEELLQSLVKIISQSLDVQFCMVRNGELAKRKIRTREVFDFNSNK